MAEKLGKIIKEKEQQPDTILADQTPQTAMSVQSPYPQPPMQTYPQQPPQQQPPYGYPPAPAPVWNPNYPYDRAPYPYPQPQQQPTMKPAVQGDLFKMEKISQGNKDFLVLSIAVDEKLARFALGRILVVTQ